MMDEDIEMLEAKLNGVATPHPHLATDSHHASPIVVDPSDDDNTSTSNEPPAVVVHDVDGKVKQQGPKSKPAHEAAANTTGAKPGSSAPKPKSSRARPRSPSPSPPPAPPPAPLQTVRLEIALGGPDNYEVDVAALAKATGQRPPTPPPVAKRYESESEAEPEGEHDDDRKSKKGKKKKNLGTEYYDLTDPFIDDSELAVDERTYFAQTKQQGFYVSSGEVALLKDKTPKKVKSKRTVLLPPPEPIAGPSNFPHAHGHSHTHAQLSQGKKAAPSGSVSVAGDIEGTKETPIALLSDAEDGSEQNGKRKSIGGGSDIGAGGKKKRKVEIHPFHPELEEALQELKDAAAKESWGVKGRFPPAMKPLLAQVALKAIRLNEYDDNFFNLMPRLFPYNRFTMSKLIKRTVFHDHTALLTARQEELLVELESMAEEGFPKALEEWEKSVVAWEKKQEKVKVEGTASNEGTPSAQPIPSATEDAGGGAMDVDKDSGDGQGKDGKDAKDSHPPPKKYRMSEAMKGIIWNLVCLSNECCRIENEKNTLEGSTSQVSEQGLRKVLYQKIVAAFPDGWMSSGQISREVSVMKKKFEKEAMENES